MRLVSLLERKAKFNKFICILISWSFRIKFSKAYSLARKSYGENFDFIISNNILEYFVLIEEVITKLSYSYRVGLLFEGSSRDYDDLLRRKFPACVLLSLNHQVLPFFSCKVYISSIAGKERYFPVTSKKIFYFHGLANLIGFKAGGLKGYSHILCATTEQYVDVLNEYSDKHAILIGYPKFSNVARTRTVESNVTKIKVLYAPTLRNMLPFSLGDVSISDSALLMALCETRSIYKILYKPHPQEIRLYKDSFFTDLVNKVTKVHGPRVLYFGHKEQRESFEATDLLVTDYSGTAITYSLKECKPSIFVAQNQKYLRELHPLCDIVGIVVADSTELKRAIDGYDFPTSVFNENRDKILHVHQGSVGRFLDALEKLV